MSLSQGYKLTLSVGADYVQFQNVDVDWGGDTLDTSSSLNSDGETPNAGFSDKDGDLQTLSVSIDTLIKDTTVTAFMLVFKPQTRYENISYTLTYGVRTWTGVGLYMDAFRMTFNIPGGARLRCNFFNLQAGFAET